MPIFSFKELKKAYRQAQFSKKIDFLMEDFKEDIVRDIFLFAEDQQIKEQIDQLLADVNSLITKYQMDKNRDGIVNRVERVAKQCVNDYIVRNIDYLPNRGRSQPLPFSTKP